VTALLLAAAATWLQDWPTYHGNFTLDGVAAEAPPDAPVRLWRFKAAARVEFTPVAAGGRIFFTAKSVVQALDLEGRPVWSATLPEKDAYSSPCLAVEGLVVVGASTGIVHAYEAATGKPRWTYDTGDTVQGSPNVAELPGGGRAIVVLAQSAGVLHALHPATGKPLWKGDPVDRADGSPGISAGRIAMGSCASALHVFGAEKGVKLHDVSAGNECQIAGGVALQGTLAYAGSRTGKMIAADLAAGKVLWTFGDSKKESFGTPAVGEKLVLFSSDDGKVYALERATGAAAWVYDSKGSPGSPVVAGNRAIVSSGGDLHLLDLADGKKLWSGKVADEITSPALVGGRIVVGADDGSVSAWGRK
jgi:outer membrane protein assembly factor BamB